MLVIDNNISNISNNSNLDLVTTEIIAMIRVNLDVCGRRGDGSGRSCVARCGPGFAIFTSSSFLSSLSVS